MPELPIIAKCPKCGDTNNLEHVHEFVLAKVTESFCNTCGKVSLLDVTKPESQQYLSAIYIPQASDGV